MIRELKAGDRVRVTGTRVMPGYRQGDTGMVKEGPRPTVTGDPYYVVQMDKEDHEWIIFLPAEIEPLD
jgi:hypothetical protein